MWPMNASNGVLIDYAEFRCCWVCNGMLSAAVLLAGLEIDCTVLHDRLW
jgi:hypothetical protein